MLVNKGDGSYVGCQDCQCRLTPRGTVEETKAKMQPECEYRCPRCASVGREIPEENES